MDFVHVCQCFINEVLLLLPGDTDPPFVFPVVQIVANELLAALVWTQTTLDKVQKTTFSTS